MRRMDAWPSHAAGQVAARYSSHGKPNEETEPTDVVRIAVERKELREGRTQPSGRGSSRHRRPRPSPHAQFSQGARPSPLPNGPKNIAASAAAAQHDTGRRRLHCPATRALSTLVRLIPASARPDGQKVLQEAGCPAQLIKRLLGDPKPGLLNLDEALVECHVGLMSPQSLGSTRLLDLN